MRKLLLGTTALAAAATLSANVAVADVSIAGFIEWEYQSRSSNISTLDGTSNNTDADIKFNFSNKTDSGLTVGYYAEMNSDGADDATSIEESYLHISGGFGKIVLGTDDGVGDYYGVASSDLPSEEINATSNSTSITITNADYSNLSSNSQVMSYHLPAMGGLTGGISYFNSGAPGDTDSTEIAFKYAIDAGGANITLGGATGSKDVSGAQDVDTQVIGVKVASGNITAAVSQSTHEAAGSDEESNGAAVSFKVSDAMTLTGYTTETEDNSAGDEYSNAGVEVKYSIASGLTAFLNVEDYDYKVGTSSGNAADSGTVSTLTIQATF
ncbi:porin [Alphaproteobacteria bacterium]|nr:porin [Alphaproteobacteria bacterium]